MAKTATLARLSPATGRLPFEQGVVRVASLVGVAPLLRERGFVPAKLLRHVGLDSHTLDHPNDRISYVVAGRLLKHCADVAACPHFGLLVGQQTTIRSLGTLGELMLRSPTVGSALRSLILNMHLQTRGGVPMHSVEGSNATLGYAIYQREMAGAVQVNDLATAYGFNILRALCGAHWFPNEVSFAHAKPKDSRPYRQFFHAPLRFDAGHSEVRFKKAWLDTQLPNHDPDLVGHLQRELSAQLMLEPDDYAEQVRRTLRTTIPTGRGSESVIAELMSLPVRTLRWHLAAQGTNFRKLMEEVRYEIARQLLLDTDMSTSEIAESLDYADASAFTRAFRRWTDEPPATWRAKFRSAEGRLRVAERAWDK